MGIRKTLMEKLYCGGCEAESLQIGTIIRLAAPMGDSFVAPPGSYLRYGDFLVLSISDVEGCELGGVLGSEEIRSSSDRFITSRNLTDQQQSVLPYESMLMKEEGEIGQSVEPRYLGVSAIHMTAEGVRAPPPKFFVQNVFQVSHGVGFEAAGEPIHYGSQVRLVLVSTGEYLHSNRKSDLVELTPHHVYEKLQPKECNFKISPRFQIRSDADYIYFKDLIVLSDVFGREVFCTSATTVTLSTNQAQKSAFRLTSYLGYETALQPVIAGGSVIQLYHKNDGCFVSTTWRGNAVSEQALSTESSLLEKSSSYWQVETVATSVRDLSIAGLVLHGTPIRLRHVMTSHYLSIRSERVAMVPDPTNETIFELLLNIDEDMGAVRDVLSASQLPLGANVRVRNRLSGQHIVITKDTKEVQLFVSSADSDFDKDVFTLFPASSTFLAIMTQVEKFKGGFERMMARMATFNLPKLEQGDLIAKATEHLETLLSGDSTLGQLIAADKASARVGLDVCDELHFGGTLLELADRALKIAQESRRAGGVYHAEERLAKTAYAVLGKIIDDNPSAARAVVDCGGVSLMVQHLMLLETLSDWTPPLLELVDTLHEGGYCEDGPSILSPADVELLLDSVHQRFLRNEVPDQYPYRLLAHICMPGKGLITPGGAGGRVSKAMQLMVCRHVLSSPLSGRSQSPFWSMMTYRTAMGPQRAGRYPELLISTSTVGQARPPGISGNEYDVPRPAELPRTRCSDADWKKCVAIRNSLLSTGERHSAVALADPNHPLKNELDRLEASINTMQAQIAWRPFTELSPSEVGFYCATLHLLVALSAGRNLWTQRMVRQLLPLDHILLFLDTELNLESARETVEDLLVEVKVLMLSVLYYCYIDSAHVPPTVYDRESVFGEQMRHQSLSAHSWDEICLQECCLKVFSLASQEDDFMIDALQNLEPDELMTCLNSLLFDEQVRQRSSPASWSSSADHEVLVGELRSLISSKSAQVVDVDQLRSVLGRMHQSKRKFLAAHSVHCLEQRALMLRIVSRFVDSEALRLWLAFIHRRLLPLTGPKDGAIYELDVLSRSHQSSLLSSDIPPEVRRIVKTTNLMENMLAVVQSLMVHRFFDPSYNAFPQVESATGQRVDFYNAFDDSMYEVVPFECADGEKMRVLRCKVSWTAQDVAQNARQPLPASTPAPARSLFDGRLSQVKAIINCCMSVVESFSGEMIDPQFHLDEDEKPIDDFFRRQFGYVQDVYGLATGTLRVQQLCLRVLSVGLDLIHSTTLGEVHKVFGPLFAVTARAKLSLDQGPESANSTGMSIYELLTAAASASRLSTAADEEARRTLTDEEARLLRARAWASLHERVERNPDMLWNAQRIFRDRTMQSLLRISLFNSEALRAEAMNLVYRLNARRAEMAQFMMSEFMQVGLDDPGLFNFLERKRFVLSQILSRFDAEGGQLSVLEADEEVRDTLMDGYLLKLRLLLMCPPGERGQIGLVNFCFLDHLDNGSVRRDGGRPDTDDHSRRVDVVADVTVEDEPGRRPHHASSLGSNMLAHSIDIYSSEESFRGIPNAHHQQFIIDAGFDTLLVDFVVRNADRLECMVSRADGDGDGLAGLFAAPGPTGGGRSAAQLLEVVRLCCLLLRVIMMKNRRAVGSIATRPLLAALLGLRNVFPEALLLIVEVLKTEPATVENISNNEFVVLIRSVQHIVRSPELLRRAGQGPDLLDANKCCDIVALIEQIILAEIRSSPHRLSMLVGVLLEVDVKASERFIDQIASLGLGLQLDRGPYDPRHFDIKYTCTLYRMDTDRITYSRLPKDVLNDPPPTLESYQKMRSALVTWRLLSPQSAFKVHLALVHMLGTITPFSLSLQKVCKKLFPRPDVVFQALMIDKMEIRDAYLSLLHGLWLSPKLDKSVRSMEDIMTPEGKPYLLALVTSIVRDARLFLLFLQDQELATMLRNSRAAPAELGMMPAQMRMLGEYLRLSVLPFLRTMLKAALYHAIDEISSPAVDASVSSCRQLLVTLQAVLAEIYVSKPSSLVLNAEDVLRMTAIMNCQVDPAQSNARVLRVATRMLSRDGNAMIPPAIKTSVFLKPQLSASSSDLKSQLDRLGALSALRRGCLEEFIPEVDRYASKAGYADVDYAMHAPTPNVVFIDDREYPIPQSMTFDPIKIAGTVPGTAYDIISNPLNCTSFRHLQSKVTAMVLTYSRQLFPRRFEQVVAIVKRVVNRPPQEFESLLALTTSAETREEADRLKDAYSKLRVSRDMKDIERRNTIAQFSHSHFLRWSKGGGLLLDLVLGHLLFALRCIKDERSVPGNVGFTLDDLCKCNDYWMSLFTTGLLRSRMDEISKLYTDQSELQLALLSVEQQRLRLVQDVFTSLGAVDVVVKQLSITAESVRRVLSPFSVQLLHRTAINVGTAINELGNCSAQDAMVASAQRELGLSLALGREHGLFQVIRAMLASYTQVFQLEQRAVPRHHISDAVKLMRFLAQLCEGHHKKAQEYLGKHRVVSEVASFVADLNKLLAVEMSAAMVTEQEVPQKHLPKVLGQSRPLIRWIDPMPSLAAPSVVPPPVPLPVSASAPHSPDRFSSAAVQSPGAPSLANSSPHPSSAPSPPPPASDARRKCRLVNITRMQALAEVITAGLEALSEFSQGPRPDIQLTVARAATTRDFATFFEFFAAFHLRAKFTDATHKPYAQKTAFQAWYPASIKAAITHQAVFPVPVDHLEWYGSDPLAVAMLTQYIREQSHTPTAKSTNTYQEGLDILGQLLRTTATINRRETAYTPGTASTMEALLEMATLSARANQKMTPSEKMSSMEFWTMEKQLAIEVRRHRAHVQLLPEALVEQNLYERIANFEKQLVALESACLKLSMSLLESCAQDALEIPNIIVRNVGNTNLVCNMSNFWGRYLTYTPAVAIASAEQCFERSLAYNYYALIMKIQDLNFDVELRDLMDEWQATNHIRVDEHIARIEVRMPDPSALTVVYFPVPQLIKQYWNRPDIVDLRDNILFPTSAAGRDSADEKVKTFLGDARKLISALRHLESLDEIWAPKSMLLRLVVLGVHSINRWVQLSFLCTLAINAILIISIKVQANERYYYRVDGHRYGLLLTALGVAHLVLTGLCFFAHAVLFGWLHVKDCWKENPEHEMAFRGLYTTRAVLALNRLGLLGTRPAHIVAGSITVTMWPGTLAVRYVLQQAETWYYFVLLACSLLGNFDSPLFFAAGMVQVMRMSKILQYVTRAFTANIDQVFATICLGVILMYFFTTLALSDRKIHNQYNFNGVGEGGCFSLESCFRLHLDYGLMQSVLWNYPREIGTAQGELFNFGFVFIMQIVIPGLVSGIIIDTFSEMRGKKQAIEEDVVNTCFICNIDREDFETTSISFDHHIHHDHNMWKYVWFMIYLDEKDKTEFFGIENFCYDLIVTKDSTRWLPVKMARALSQIRDKYDLFTIYNKITLLQNNLDRVGGDLKADSSSHAKEVRDGVRGDVQNLEKTLTKLLKKIERKAGGGAVVVPAGGDFPSPTR